MSQQDAYKTLKQYTTILTRQQVKTLAGQIWGGNPNGAMVGLSRILERNARTVKAETK